MNDRAIKVLCVGEAVAAALCCLLLRAAYGPAPIDHEIDALRAEKVRSLTAPSAVYLCEEWFCDGAVALPDMCEAEGGTLRRTGAWIGVTDTLTLGLRRPGMMSSRRCGEREVKPEPCGSRAFCGGGDE